MTSSPGSAAPVVPRAVRGLSLVSLFNDFSSEMVYPLLPAFVTRVLGGGALVLGALDGAADLTAALLRWVSGRLADRPGWSGRLITVGYGLAVVVRPVVALTTAAWQVIGLRVLDRLGKGLRSPARDAWIARATRPEARGRAYGFHRAADHFGAVAGSLAAWLLLAGQADLRTVIVFSAVPGLLAMAILMPVLRLELPNRDGSTGELNPAAPATRDVNGPAFWIPVLSLALLVVTRLPETLLLLRLQDLGVPVAMVPLVWAALHIVRTLGSYPGGWLTDRFGSRRLLALAGALFALVLLVMARPVLPPVAIATFLVLGLVAGLTEPAERAVVAQLAPHRTGRAFGSAQGLTGLLALPAGLLFGLVYQQSGGPAALMTSALTTGAAALLWTGVSGLPKQE